MYVKAIQKLGGQRSVLFFSKIREDFKKNSKKNDIAQWDCSVGFFKSYFFECKSGRNSIKVAEKRT